MINTKKMNTLLAFTLLILIASPLVLKLISNIYKSETFVFIFNIVKYQGHPLPYYPIEKIMEWAKMMLVNGSSLLISFVSILLFLKYREEKIKPENSILWSITLIFFIGTIIRLLLACMCYGNTDMQSYEIVADIVERGGNVYAETRRYNYSPIWFMLIGILKRIQLQFPSFSFHFVVRSFLCGVDLVTLLFLLLIAKEEKISKIKTALFFYLNPVSFLITGYHGQFENLAILMVTTGIFGYIKLKNKPIGRKIILWLFATLGMIVKHNIFYEVIICLNFVRKRFWMKVFLFAISSLIFMLFFIPYWSIGNKGIIQNVFLYSSDVRFYGISSLFKFQLLKYLFILGLFIYPCYIKSQDIIKQCLLGVLFFLVFTTGIGVQYFVLPIAFGTLRPSKGFIFYSIVGTLFILGSPDNVHIPIFSGFGWNTVWIGAIYWFIIENVRQTGQNTEEYGTVLR